MHFAQEVSSWQLWRDQQLLRTDSNSLLLFSPPDISNPQNDKIHIVLGKGWASQCGLNEQLCWLNQDFAVIKNRNLVVCPYFDYRQLSNQKILYLCELLVPMLSKIQS